MTEVRRVLRMVVLLVVPILISACAARTDSTGPAGGGGVCASGVGSQNPHTPIVCVDDSVRKLSVHPDEIIIDDIQQKRPITLVWMTKSGRGDLRIEMKDEGCVTRPHCAGNGRCTAQSIPNADRRCKYDVWIEGGNHDRLDPTVVITPCCGT